MRLAFVCLVVALAGCAGRDEPAADGFKSLGVDDVVALRSGGKAAVLDANGDDTRAREGIVPGAVLLSSYKQYDVEKELPPDKGTALVFYCANEH
jgi:rhodanese-related sulfurtransferase